MFTPGGLARRVACESSAGIAWRLRLADTRQRWRAQTRFYRHRACRHPYSARAQHAQNRSSPLCAPFVALGAVRPVHLRQGFTPPRLMPTHIWRCRSRIRRKASTSRRHTSRTTHTHALRDHRKARQEARSAHIVPSTTIAIKRYCISPPRPVTGSCNHHQACSCARICRTSAAASQPALAAALCRVGFAAHSDKPQAR